MKILLITSEEWNEFDSNKETYGDLVSFLAGGILGAVEFTTQFSVEMYVNYKSTFDKGNASGNTLLPIETTDQQLGADFPSALKDKDVITWLPDCNGKVTFPAVLGSQYVFTLIIRKL